MDKNKISKSYKRSFIVSIVIIGTIIGAIDGYFVSKMGISLYNEMLTTTQAADMLGKTIAIVMMCCLLWCMFFIATWACIAAINAMTNDFLSKTLNKILMKIYKM